METIPFSDWESWYALCALALCEEDTRRRLSGFALSRMDHFVRHYVITTNVNVDDANLCVPAQSDCWHRFETHAALTTTRQGKCYKEWLFARLSPDASDPPIDIIQGGASLIMRDVAKRYLQDEFAPRGSVSMNKPCGPDPDAPTFADLLPGEAAPIDTVEAREYEQLAAKHTQQFFQDMSRRERLALLAQFEGVSLAHPAIENIAGRRKTVLSQTARDAVARLALGLQQTYREDGADAVLALGILALHELEKRLKIWKNSETDLRILFNRIEKEA